MCVTAEDEGGLIVSELELEIEIESAFSRILCLCYWRELLAATERVACPVCRQKGKLAINHEFQERYPFAALLHLARLQADRARSQPTCARCFQIWKPALTDREPAQCLSVLIVVLLIPSQCGRFFGRQLTAIVN